MPDASSEVPLLKGRRILLGVCGSIAAYKAAELASKLTQAGAELDVVLTESAQKFVSALTFQSLTGRRAYTDSDLWSQEGHVLHVGLAQQAQLLVVAPATADTIARLAHGRADNLLSIAALAAECPIIVAPAMDAGMFEHPATQANLAVLRDRGVTLVGPAEGRMASGLMGMGRMLEPEQLLGHIRWRLGQEGPLAGRTVIVTAGGTQEPLDPVRVLANRSSGKQGFALAQAAIDRGAAVILIAGPSTPETPVGADRVKVETAAQMAEAVAEALPRAEVLLMAAAVADFRPTRAEPNKLKRQSGVPLVSLEPTEDILVSLGENRPKLVVGFAAESDDLLASARTKLEEKDLDLIVANDITASDAGFGADTNRVTLIGRNGEAQSLPLLTKVEVAERVLDMVVELLG
ncbi:MAG TPA: bifunctional phosphopantothenoylcysteine decarboxylase/phosphopantothenate--cysteine ligase CoaBC [Anaerolineales bacterium]